MEQANESLQIRAIKTAFGSLTDVEQRNLMHDLLELGRFEYVRTQSMASFNDYRHDFVNFFLSYWIKTYVVVSAEFVDQCFEIWNLLEQESIGDEIGTRCEVGDWFLSTVDLDPTDGQTYKFESEVSRHSVFREEIFKKALVHEVQLVTHLQFGERIFQANLRLIDLFDLVFVNPEDAYATLALFDYFKSDKVKHDRYMLRFMEAFPERKTLEEILDKEKLKLSTKFLITIWRH